jgi:hypothetical protein
VPTSSWRDVVGTGVVDVAIDWFAVGCTDSDRVAGR